jgi:hypothetical protein
MIGDGGQSGFDVADASFRFHSFFDTSPEVNFANGDTADWIWVADPMYLTGGQFYSPIISDPKGRRRCSRAPRTSSAPRRKGLAP